MSDDIKNRYIAELRAVRALWMYDLFDLYGPVPAITDPEKILNPTQDFTVTRPSREEYITFVETELKEVINAQILPVAWTGSDYGHVSQATAMMVLLQLYMHEGGYCRNKHVGDYQDYFKKAEQVAKDIMDLESSKPTQQRNHLRSSEFSHSGNGEQLSCSCTTHRLQVPARHPADRLEWIQNPVGSIRLFRSGR